VVLATARAKEGIDFELLTFDDLLRGVNDSEAKLRACSVVFASATFLRDLSELDPLVARLKRPWNRIVVGGALAGTLHAHWEGSPLVDIRHRLRQLLVSVLAAWMRSAAAERARARTDHEKDHTRFLFSGTPASLRSTRLDRLTGNPATGAARHHDPIRGVRLPTVRLLQLPVPLRRHALPL
jgi:hypothetical protein